MEKNVNDLRAVDFIDLPYQELVDELEKLGEPIIGRLIQQLDAEHMEVRAVITKIRAQIISDAFEDTNVQQYREGDMDFEPEKRKISPSQILTVEGLLAQLNNYYVAEGKLLGTLFIMKGIKMKKAQELMSGK